jgi:hypothetical protein
MAEKCRLDKIKTCCRNGGKVERIAAKGSVIYHRKLPEDIKHGHH